MYSMRFLDDEQENRNLLLKLPDWCRTRWARKVAEAKMDSMNYPGFSKFVKFVKVESDIANDPITCGSSSSSLQSGSSSSKPRYSNNTSTQGSKTYNCVLCGGSHSLQKCDKFIGKSYDDRCAFIRENHLCFGCFFSGHRSKDCRRRMRFDVCSRLHPTLLHNPSISQEKEESSAPIPIVSNAFSSNAASAEKSSMVVPVWLTHSKDSNRSRLVYALLYF